ncbi:MAG: ATP-binding protein [Deltaproteobacteria bacterium]|nr:ATP-binding protein [Deltaproteobacteria bacterium]
MASRLDQLPALWSALDRALEPMGASAKWTADVNLMLVEGATNAIMHGHAADGRPLRVEVELAAGQLEIRIFDSGPGFELPLGEVPVPDALAESGRGIFLMKTLADSILYRRKPGQNVLVLCKGIPDAKYRHR